MAGSSKRHSVVLDASAVVRALVDRTAAAVAWIRRIDEPAVRTVVPDLFFVEITNAVLLAARSGRMPAKQAEDHLAYACALPLEVRPLRELSPYALRLALLRGLTAYDACYAVVAEAEGAVMVTADERLAAAVTRSELV